MRLSSAIRAALFALTVTCTGLATAAQADHGSIRFNVIKAGFVIGGSAGSGTLVFHGRRYLLSIGGVSYGFTFGGSATDFVGTVSNIRRPSDVNGVVEVLFRQQFRHDLRAGRFTMEFALSGNIALQQIADAAGVSIILILSDINMPGMTGLELLPKARR